MRISILFLISLTISFIFPLKVIASSPVQGSSEYITPSGVAPADGTSTETVSVYLKDADQSPVIGDIITLSSSNDSTASFPQNDQTTDANGRSTFTIIT